MSAAPRPSLVYVDEARCIRCEVCEEYAPGMLDAERPIPAEETALDAMAACPTGAIRWLEREEPEMKQLDVRTIPPRERHPMIFRTFDELAPGEAFELVNDHDPKPLYYQLQAERAGQLNWAYLEQGPERWRVKVGKAA